MSQLALERALAAIERGDATRAGLAAELGVSRPRVSQLLRTLHRYGLAEWTAGDPVIRPGTGAAASPLPKAKAKRGGLTPRQAAVLDVILARRRLSGRGPTGGELRDAGLRTVWTALEPLRRAGMALWDYGDLTTLDVTAAGRLALATHQGADAAAIGAQVRELRLRLGLTQGELAAAIGRASGRAVHEWERGRITPSEVTLRRIFVVALEAQMRAADD